MFNLRFRTRHDTEDKLQALARSLAMIEFDLDGNILDANPNFLAAVGYGLEEIRGKHHSLFVDAGVRASAEYTEFWRKLKAGEFQAGRYRRIGKGRREIWIEATYNPVLDRDGKPYKVVKFATDITARMLEHADLRGQVDAIRKALAVIEFDLDGNVLDANENFCATVGYGLNEVKGRHHGMFVDDETRRSPEYADFWRSLREGKFQKSQYKRVGKGGREIWIEASYNPILDASGRPYKVVKYATDVTRDVRLLLDLRGVIEGNFGEVDAAIAHSRQASGEASAAAGEAAGNVRAMASASEELAASVAEVARSMATARTASDAAYGKTAGAADLTDRLSAAATAMGGIVGLIRNIAGQINLLALNATIESARAGEAGRGFAVVANEVKNLAGQAARATEQISGEIDAIQGVSTGVVDALREIRESVETVRDQVGTATTAVEQQSIVTREMSSSMHDASASVTQISSSMNAMTGSLATVTHAVEGTKEAASVLAR